MDAAIAMNAMLAVVYPHMCGPGGDLFITFFDSATQRLYCLNASGYAPRLASREMLLSGPSTTEVPARGPLSATVPGAIAGWELATRRFGSRRLEELVQPAAELADEGFPVSAGLARAVAANASVLKGDELLSRWFFVDARPVGENEQIRIPELASTLRRLSRAPRSLYEGSIGRELVRAVEEAGGWLRADDLAEYEPEWVEPISVHYHGVRVFTNPPNSQGIAALQMLNILSVFGDLTPGTAEAIDALVRAKRAAFIDRDRYVGDPKFVSVPVEEILSREHADRSVVNAAPRTTHSRVGGDTVYVCALDADGGACSLIQSIYFPFGSGFVAGSTGIILHNRAHYFSLGQSDANRLEPRKRPLHTLMASIALRNGRPCLIFGTMGADGQPQTNVQVLERVLAGGSPAEAVAAPRVLSGRMWIEDDDDVLVVEDGIGAEAVAALRDAGHRVRVLPERDETLGHAHAIAVGADGEVSAGADPRSDGAAFVV